jgi:MFS family permease
MFSGVVLVWRLEASTSYAHAAVSMLLVGLGVGLMMQVFILSVQASVPRAGIGSATALVQFVRMVGATVGVAAMGALVNRGVAGGDLEDGLRSAFLAPVVAAGLVLVIVLFALEDAKLEGEPEIVGVS